MKATIPTAALLISLVGLTHCQTAPGTPEAQPAAETATAGTPAAAPAGTTSNCLAPPALTYVTPKDFALTRQADANCFAWQQFISLNWVASQTMRGQPDTAIPASQFGEPNNTSLSVWETYKEVDEVFLANAKPPAPWNSWPGASRGKVFGGMISKTDPQPPLDLSEVGQASLGNPWLTAQSGILTLYERRINEDEFNYIVQNKLYDATVQQTFVTTAGINLPDGTANSAAYGPLGSIETKAAWIELPNQADWPRFKIARAVIHYPDQQPKQAVVGLVGLHIIHKTALGQQFIWATFEHRQNAPDRTQVAGNQLNPPYTYYNPNCDPATDRYKCVANADPTKVNGGKNPYSAPIQVVRDTPIPSRPNNDVVGLNQYAWSVIAAQNPDSVYLNYELVNTLWSNQNTTIPAGSRTPLIAAQLSPGASQEPVANATMETYVQGMTCLNCHASAPIASITPQTVTKVFDPATAGTARTATNPYASDYSFVFDNAGSPKANQGNQ